MLNDALLQMQRRLDDNDLTEAGGAAGIKLRLRSSEKRRFTRSSASGEHTKQSTFQTTKDDSVLDTALGPANLTVEEQANVQNAAYLRAIQICALRQALGLEPLDALGALSLSKRRAFAAKIPWRVILSRSRSDNPACK